MADERTILGIMVAAEREILAGLPNERDRISEARINLDYYRGNNEHYIERREGEDHFDFAARTKRTSKITGRTVDVLAGHLFNPGPSWRFDLPESVVNFLDLALATAYDAFIGADRAATLNDVALIQVAPTGVPDAPIRLQVWDSSQFAVWTGDDPETPVAICTIDRVDEQTRYTLWTVSEVRVYQTERLLPGQTSGGRVSRLVDSYQNPYGCLPFVVCPYQHQSGQFWPDAPGTAVRKANAAIDAAMSDLGQAISVHLFPVGVATNVHESFNQTVLRPGKFVHVPSDTSAVTGVGGAESKLSYIQADVAVDQTWTDIDSFINHTLEMCGVPRSAVRMDQTGTASGVAIIAEQLPLITRARQRQPLAARWVQALVKVVLQVGAAWYRRADLLVASRSPRLTLTWPPIELPLPGPDQDNADAWELEHGLASQVDILMRRRGISRDEAIATLKRVREDKELLGPAPVTPIPVTPAPTPTPSPTPAPQEVEI